MGAKKRKIGAAHSVILTADIKKMLLLGGINDVTEQEQGCWVEPCTNRLIHIFLKSYRLHTISSQLNQPKTHDNTSQHYLFTCTFMYDDSDYSWGALCSLQMKTIYTH